MNSIEVPDWAVAFDREAIFQSAEVRAKLYALMLLVEGPGCLRWQDGNGFRLKDTKEWVEFYCLVKDMQNFKLTNASVVAALEAEVERLRNHSEQLKSELSETAQVCGEAYQVVGILLDETKQFGSEHGDKILTNLWEGKLIHKDVIPWSFKADRHG